MSFLPIEKVRGEHLVDREAVMTIPASTRFADRARISAHVGAPVEAISRHMMGGRAVAEVSTAKGIKLFDAQTGEFIPPIGAAQAIAIANSAWISASKPAAKAWRVTKESLEYRATLPASAYDRLLALLTREARWRARLFAALAPQNGERIRNDGCGTGSCAKPSRSSSRLMAALKSQPDADGSLETELTRIAGVPITADWSIDT